MVNKKSSPKKEKKRYTFQLSFSSLLLLCIGLIFILGWLFALGIIVGKGFFPNTIDTFSFFKRKAVEEKEKKKTDHLPLIKEEELTFYNQLVDKKDRAKRRVLSKPILKEKDSAKEETKVEQSIEDIRNYSVQVAALKDKGETEKMVKRLIRSGYTAYYHQALIKGEMYYRIRCGPFPNLKEAEKYAKILANNDGFKPFIVYPAKID